MKRHEKKKQRETKRILTSGDVYCVFVPHHDIENAHRTVGAGPDHHIMKSGRARLAAGHTQNSRVGGYNGCTWYLLNTGGWEASASGGYQGVLGAESKEQGLEARRDRGLAKICAADQPMPNNAEQNMTERG